MSVSSFGHPLRQPRGAFTLLFLCEKSYTYQASSTPSFTAIWLPHHHRPEYPNAGLYL